MAIHKWLGSLSRRASKIQADKIGEFAPVAFIYSSHLNYDPINLKNVGALTPHEHDWWCCAAELCCWCLGWSIHLSARQAQILFYRGALCECTARKDSCWRFNYTRRERKCNRWCASHTSITEEIHLAAPAEEVDLGDLANWNCRFATVRMCWTSVWLT